MATMPTQGEMALLAAQGPTPKEITTTAACMTMIIAMGTMTIQDPAMVPHIALKEEQEGSGLDLLRVDIAAGVDLRAQHEMLEDRLTQLFSKVYRIVCRQTRLVPCELSNNIWRWSLGDGAAVVRRRKLWFGLQLQSQHYPSH